MRPGHEARLLERLRTPRLAALSCLLGTVACEPASVAGPSLGQPTVLGVDEVAEFSGEGLRVAFTAVENDSRCPPPSTGTVCVWEGVATVAGWAEKAGQPRSAIALATTNAAGHSTRTGYLRYEIELLELAPPRVGEIRQSDYRLTVVVRRR